MNTIWVIGGLAIAGAVLGLVTSWRRADRRSDMGAVSHQWISEQRLGPGSDSRR
jgi:hypothetical protein